MLRPWRPLAHAGGQSARAPRRACRRDRRRPCLRASAFRVCPLKLLGRELPPAAQTLLPNSLKPLPSSAGTTSVDFGGRDRGGGGGVRQRRRCDPSVCPSSVRLSIPQGRKRDRVELELVIELTRTRELLCGFGASSFPSSRSFEFEFDEAAGLRVRVFTEFLWKRLKSWFEFEKRHFPSTAQ